MNVATVVTLLSFCATFALPVPIDKSDQGRVERTISVEELESELEEIEDHVDAVRKKVKETATGNKGLPTEGIFSTPSADTTVPINEKIQVTTPSLKPTNQTISTISPTPTGSNSKVVKIQVEKLQPEVVVKENKPGEEKSKIEIKVEKLAPSEKEEIQVEKITPAPSEAEENTGDTVSVEKVSAGQEKKHTVAEESIRGKVQVTKISTENAPVKKVDEMSVEKEQIEQKEKQKEEEKGASAESVVVEEVEKKKESGEKPPGHISVKKTANDEELDLEVEGIRKNKPFISVEKTSVDDKQTNVKKKETSKASIVVEKVNDEENKKETKPLIQISVEKMENEEDLDLAIGNTKKSNNNETVISVEEISPTEKATEVKIKLTTTTVSVEVEKVNEVEEDNEITAKKVQNDDDEDQGKEPEESEEEDLETGTVGKENTKSEKTKQAQVKEEAKKTKSTSDQVTNDESEEKNLNLERRDMINNEKEKEDKSVVKKTKENVKVAKKKVELVQPSINTASSHNQDTKQEAAEEEDLQMKVQKPQMEASPTNEAPPAKSDKAKSKNVEKVQSATSSDEEVLDDANDNRHDEEKELEDEQEVLTEEETPEERKIAQAFDKALEKERNRAMNTKTEAPTPLFPILTTKKQSTQTRETGSEKERVKGSSKAKSKGGLSIEELELAALAEKTLHDDDTKEEKVSVSIQTSPTTAVKEKKNPEATVAVTKETTKTLLSEKETAKEEKKLKEELAKEMKLEKSGHPPLIEVTKITEKPSMEPATGTVEEDPNMNHKKEITNNETKKEAVPAGQDGEEEQERQLEN